MSTAILHLEDSSLDAALIAQRLARAELVPELARDRAEFVAALSGGRHFDIILSDYQLPDIDGLEALELARRHRPDTPFVFVSGALGEELAVETLKLGATDYVLKHRLERLVPAIERALAEARERAERRRAEADASAAKERLALAQSAGRSGVFDWLIPEGRVVWSAELEDLYGIPRGSFEGTFDGWARRVVPEDAAAVTGQVRACMAARGDAIDYEFRAVLPGGTRRWLAGKARFLYAPDGAPLRMIGINVDTHDRKEMEQRLREQDRRKDEFLALLAHELRNPLAPIRNGLEVIRLAEGLPAPAVRARDMMTRQLAHMVRLIDDLLDVARINTNKLHLKRERVALADVIDSAVEAARPLIDASGHTLVVRLPDEQLVLDADPTRLSQVFSNLLTNSAKYTRPGGRIELTAARAGGAATVSVEDDGLGIPLDYLPRLFDMFSQADRVTERTTGGLGIGLALVKGLVEMHGGTVEAHSDGPGEGSRFTVRLAVVESAPARAETADRAPAARGGTRRVLVADDNADGAESLALMLELMGHEVHTAADGVQAVETAERLRPDLILMDLGMPRLNGLDATAQIRAREWGRGVTIVALTGWGQDADRGRTRDAGCDGHLVKPVALADLERVLSAGSRPVLFCPD
jgi:signal transduction histidine kinase/DNA-binding response OmpR family regulator